ncbi:phage baseplate assembly protein V [Paenibacillus turpanensis]|uniref:phage baseplate assembly protein V n=1 Tax=Paenibacillus turpanensis TaxID=2689078 RepID=UPI00140BECD2|nr:phage baseplate assembly protein V [Paenibacillus turpanensis]
MMIRPEISFAAADPFTQSIHGVLVGVVSDNNDPDKLGRVKLKLPLQETTTETDWVRIATLMSGNGIGCLFIPEVGDEVLVAFHLGDLRQPFVIGMLWNEKNKPPLPAEKNDERKIISRSGNELVFNDKAGEESFKVKTKKGQQIEFTDQNSKIRISDHSGNNVITIEGASVNCVSIQSSSTKITLNTAGEITMESQQEVTIKSSRVQIEATAALSLKAGASLDLKSDGIITIQGSMVKMN